MSAMADAAIVKILRDAHGIPHVRSTTVAGASFGQGFAHAQDRMWAMDADRLKALGRWAEVVGPKAVEQDKLFRKFRLAETSQVDYAAVLPATKQMLDAYADGVNAFIASAGPAPTPEHALLGVTAVERWEPWQCLAVYKFRHVLMGGWEGKTWRDKVARAAGPDVVARMYPLSKADETLILTPGSVFTGAADVDALADLSAVLAAMAPLHNEDGGGSNNWVVGGARTQSGKPLLAGDPHRGVDLPSVYYQNHLACDAFDAIGLSFPGVPGLPHFGHNAGVAWCITHTGADTQDLFVERFQRAAGPAAPLQYLHKGAWHDAHVKKHVIRVRGGEDVQFEVVTTCHGSVVAGDPASGSAITMQYTATEATNSGWDCLLPMLCAASCADFDAAMTGWVDPVNNLLTADVHGGYRFRLRGKVPKRPSRNGWLPVPGWTGEFDWQGCIPYAEMPTSVDPEQGWIATANNRVVGRGYPHYIALFWAADHRAARLRERILDVDTHSVASMTAIHADVLSRPACALLPVLHTLTPASPAGRAALAVLRAWDGQMHAGATAPAIYAALREELLCALVRPLLPVDLAADAFDRPGRGGPSMLGLMRSRIVVEVADGSSRLLPRGVSPGAVLTDALERGVEALTAALGPDMSTWQWGQLHQLKVTHPLAGAFPEATARMTPPPAPMGGDGDTVQAASFSRATGYSVTGTSVARYVFDPSDWDASGWVVPHGASGRAGDAHYTDQHATWAGHGLVPMLFSWSKIEAAATSVVEVPVTSGGAGAAADERTSGESA
jgi:penicillin amidase